MQTFFYVALGLAILLGIAYFFYKKNHPTYKDITVPMPAVKNQGVLFGYYASVRPEDYDNTKDHTNLFWYCGFFGFNHETYLMGQEVFRIFRESAQKLVFEVSPWIAAWTEGKDRKAYLHPNAEAQLRICFDQLRSEGLLNRIDYMAMIDEPQLNVTSKEEYAKMVALVKRVAADYDELMPKWLCIYLNFEPFWSLGEHDVVGVDSYKQKSEVLNKGEHARLVKELLPHQKTLILPGCAYGQDPVPFINWALTYDNVEMVVAFLWFANAGHGTDGSKGYGMTGLEMRDEAYKALWREQAHILMQG